MTAKRTSRVGKVLIWVGIVLLLVGVAPIALAALASWIAEANGCQLNEGMANSCLIGGSDWGSALYTMFVAGWLFLVTMLLIPVGLIAFVVGIIVRAKTPTQTTDPEPAA
jgi:hypothetical protein